MVEDWRYDQDSDSVVGKRVKVNKQVNQKQTNMASKEQEKQCTRSFYAKIAVKIKLGS